MEFNEFKEELVKFMSERYPDVEFHVNDIVKNNGLHLTGIAGISPDKNAGPNIYINELYEKVAEGAMTFGAAATIVEQRYIMASKESINIEKDIFDYEKVKDKLICRLVNKKLNSESLQEVPHKIVGSDLAVTYRYLHAKDENGVASALICNKQLETWGVSVDELHKVALYNTERLFPAKMNSLLSTVKDILFEGLLPEDDLLKQEINDEIELYEGQDVQLYVLTNDVGLNGATAILYPSVQEAIEKRFGEDVYILPCSIHETMVAINCDDEAFLLDMVRTANQEAVRMEDYLADSIYQVKDGELVNVNQFEVEIEEVLEESYGEITDEFDAEM